MSLLEEESYLDDNLIIPYTKWQSHVMRFINRKIVICILVLVILTIWHACSKDSASSFDEIKKITFHDAYDSTVQIEQNHIVGTKIHLSTTSKHIYFKKIILSVHCVYWEDTESTFIKAGIYSGTGEDLILKSTKQTLFRKEISDCESDVTTNQFRDVKIAFPTNQIIMESLGTKDFLIALRFSARMKIWTAKGTSVQASTSPHSPDLPSELIMSKAKAIVDGRQELCPYMVAIFAEPRAQWRAYIVLNWIAISLVLGACGHPIEFVLLTACALFSIIGALPIRYTYLGFANRSVLSLAGLMIIFRAIQDTGYPSRLMRSALGSPKTARMALVRMSFPVIFMSSFFQHDLVVSMALPVIQGWCSRLNLAPVVLLLPLTMLATLGGGLTVIGSASNIIARTLFSEVYLRFFDMTSMGIIFALIGALYVCALAPLILGRHEFEDYADSPEEVERGYSLLDASGHLKYSFAESVKIESSVYEDSESEFSESESDKEIEYTSPAGSYVVPFILKPSCALITLTVEDSNLRHWNGTGIIEIRTSNGEVKYSSDGVGSELFALMNVILEEGDTIKVVGSAEGISSLRTIKGFHLAMQSELNLLGGHRRRRRLYEVLVSEESSLAGATVTTRDCLSRFDACIIAVRRGHQQVCRMSYDGFRIELHDILLLEGLEDFIKKNGKCFALIRKVECAPPRTGRTADRRRFMASIFTLLTGLIFVLLGEYFDNRMFVDLPVICCIIFVILMLIKAINPSDVWSYIDGT
eukprot:GHVL01023559.1.p1 GENE.GHVL01023559.1~~GHVL01023559.1.p1  ORF type:complete len:756 (+),score=62.70 GHVL01023559.1:43-2310(+)